MFARAPRGTYAMFGRYASGLSGHFAIEVIHTDTML